MKKIKSKMGFKRIKERYRLYKNQYYRSITTLFTISWNRCRGDPKLIV